MSNKYTVLRLANAGLETGV